MMCDGCKWFLIWKVKLIDNVVGCLYDTCMGQWNTILYISQEQWTYSDRINYPCHNRTALCWCCAQHFTVFCGVQSLVNMRKIGTKGKHTWKDIRQFLLGPVFKCNMHKFYLKRSAVLWSLCNNCLLLFFSLPKGKCSQASWGLQCCWFSRITFYISVSGTFLVDIQMSFCVWWYRYSMEDVALRPSQLEDNVIAIPIIKIIRSQDHPIFIMGIPKPGKTIFILRQGPGGQFWGCCLHVVLVFSLSVACNSFENQVPIDLRMRSSDFNTLRPRQNGRHFADDIFKCIFLNENAWIALKISLKFVPKVRINNIPTLIQIMAWRRPGDKPLSAPMMVSLLTHICVSRPQWVKIRNKIIVLMLPARATCPS